MPAPSAGIDSRLAVVNTPPENCLYTYNMMPSEYGMAVRQGYREWAEGMDSGSSLGVRTIVVFDGSVVGSADDRLFAITNEGIWDVTSFDTSPTLKLTFADQTADVGYGVQAHYIDDAGAEFLLYADGVNGLFEYTESTDAWTQVTGITGPTITNVCFVVVHKQRIWMIEENSTQAWYLPVGSKSGTATPFYFGSKFPHGGRLNGLYNWTVDGGAGVDDILIAVSSAGDVIPYKGEDPSSAETWSNIGTYFIGKQPKGRRLATEHGGNVLLLSAWGLVSMSDLLQGVDARDSASSLAFKISKPIRQALSSTLNEYGWEPLFVPAIGSLIVMSPQAPSTKYQQYVMNIATESWGYWRGVPGDCMVEWNGKIYFGTSDSVVHVMDVYRDGVTLTPPVSGDNGDPIEFSLLTSYQKYGQNGLFKQVQLIRPDMLSSNVPTYQTKALYDYEVGELVQVPLIETSDESLFGSAIWDAAIWSSGVAVNSNRLIGSGGLGRAIAIACRGECLDETRLVSFDVMWTSGGPT
jgi:hypothetical protein